MSATNPATLPIAPLRKSRRTPAALSIAALGVAALAMTGCNALTSVGAGTSAPTVAAASTATFYVDPAGQDTNSGTSPGAAWRSLAKVDKTSLRAGNRVLFKRGGHWVGRLAPVGSGTATAPISFGAYGSGSLPLITGGSQGDCIRLNTNYVTVDSFAVTGCGYDGFNVMADHDAVTNSQVSKMKAGIRVNNGSDFGSYQHNTLTNNNVMMVNTRGTGCGTPSAKGCNNDSGASAFLVHGNFNDLGFNTISGSIAPSYDYGYDGAAFDVYDGNNNLIHDNVSRDNLVLSELGRSAGGSANGNVYRRNTVTATCGTRCDMGGGVTLRGGGTSYGPNLGTTIDGNIFTLVGAHTHGVICASGCPSSTVVTNNRFAAAARAIWMDGSGWTLHGNVIVGQTIAQAGTRKAKVAAGSSVTW